MNYYVEEMILYASVNIQSLNDQNSRIFSYLTVIIATAL